MIVIIILDALFVVLLLANYRWSTLLHEREKQVDILESSGQQALRQLIENANKASLDADTKLAKLAVADILVEAVQAIVKQK